MEEEIMNGWEDAEGGDGGQDAAGDPSDYMSDAYFESGDDIASMKRAMYRIERATSLETADFSDLTVLEPLGVVTKKGIPCAAFRGGEAIRWTGSGLALDAQGAFISADAAGAIDGNPVFCFGSCRTGWDRALDAGHEWLYLTGASMYEKTLSNRLGMRGLGRGPQRAMAIAEFSSAQCGKLPLGLMVRRRGRLKKAFAAFGGQVEHRVPCIDDFLDAVWDVLPEEDPYVCYWQASQRSREACLEFPGMPENAIGLRPALSFTFSDTGWSSPYVQAVWRRRGAADGEYIIQKELRCHSPAPAAIRKAVVEALSALSAAGEAMGRRTRAVRFRTEDDLVNLFGREQMWGYTNEIRNVLIPGILEKYGNREVTNMELGEIARDIMSHGMVTRRSLRDPRASLKHMSGSLLRAMLA